VEYGSGGPEMISAVLFDMDGTLLETEELKALSYARAAVELRPEHVREADVLAAFGDLVGLSREEAASALMRRFGLEGAARERMHEFEADEPWQAFAGVRLRIYEGLLGDPDLLLKQRYPHNIELLHELRRQGYPTALTTMSHRHHVRRVLSVLGLADAFDVVVPRDDVRRGKPDPEIDLLAARKLGVPPEEFLVIEDSPAGVKAALAAGMVVIAVATTLTRRGLRESGVLDPQRVVEDPRTLPAVVRRRIEAAGGKRVKE
jgi:beta-phosphoglucomutase